MIKAEFTISIVIEEGSLSQTLMSLENLIYKFNTDQSYSEKWTEIKVNTVKAEIIHS